MKSEREETLETLRFGAGGAGKAAAKAERAPAGAETNYVTNDFSTGLGL